jgi:type IV pilus assembly protein PilC
MKIDPVIVTTRDEKSGGERTRQKDSIWSREITFTGKTAGSSFKSRFFAELALLVSSGMDIRRSLDIIEGGTAKVKEREMICSLKEFIINGFSISEAIEKSGRFEPYDIMTLSMGEETGALSVVLDSLAVHYARKISQRRQVTGALTYPVLVLVTTLASLFFMLNYIVPMFEDVFKRFQGELPPLTKAIVRLSGSFGGIALGLLFVTGAVILLVLINRKKERFRAFSAKVISKTPVAGDIVTLNYRVRFTQIMALLISSKVHLVKGLEMARKVIGYYPAERALATIVTEISSGVSLSDAMVKHGFFDRKIVAMTRVGEEVNRLETIYDQLYKQYSEDLDVRIRTMNNLLEPVLIIFVGLMVGIILVAMYLPIFQMGINIGGN